MGSSPHPTRETWQGRGAGRSNASICILARRHVHVFVWSRRLGADSLGVTIRWRRGDLWRHVRLIVGQRNAPQVNRVPVRVGRRVFIRPTLTVVELSSWTTRGGTKTREGLKSYLRVKASPAGRVV